MVYGSNGPGAGYKIFAEDMRDTDEGCSDEDRPNRQCRMWYNERFIMEWEKF